MPPASHSPLKKPVPVNKTPGKLLVIRNDKLGDFVLSLPSFAILKQNLPDTEIHALVPAYTAPLAKMCADIDHIIFDTEDDTVKSSARLSREIARENYDAVITLYSTTRIGIAVWRAGITVRVAPATKLAQLFYNYKISQRRSRSEKPEYEYNRDLAEYYLSNILDMSALSIPAPAYLAIADNVQSQTRQDLCSRLNIPAQHKLIFIHPGSGGSARNLSLAQYALLLNNLDCTYAFTTVISCAPAEVAIANSLAEQLSVENKVYVSDQGLEKFVAHIALADVFISGSTGPLHIAGALNRPTAGFYPRRQSATSLRWQTLNSASRRLAFSPPDNADAEDMQAIDVHAAAKLISNTFLR